jgi:hypothetical protein
MVQVFTHYPCSFPMHGNPFGLGWPAMQAMPAAQGFDSFLMTHTTCPAHSQICVHRVPGNTRGQYSCTQGRRYWPHGQTPMRMSP